MSSYRSFEELEAWKACRIVSKWAIEVTRTLQKSEYDMKDNFPRAARSTTRNIAEGFGRFSYKENIHFCRISRGSLYEMIDDTITMHEENQITLNEYKTGREKINHAIKVLNGYIAYLQKQTQ
ncbi:MAG: hypothetical protein RL596_1116 [Bacteroidota bacterium]|jgi:four helix bundle protein